MFPAFLWPLLGEQAVHCRIWCSALVVLAVVVWSWDASCVHCESYCPSPYIHDARSQEPKNIFSF